MFEASAQQHSSVAIPVNKSSHNETKSLTSFLKATSQSSSYKESILSSHRDSVSAKTKASTLPFNRSITVDNNLEHSLDSFTSRSTSNCVSGGSTSSSSSSSSESAEPHLVMNATGVSSASSPGQSDLTPPIVQQPQPVKSGLSLFSSQSASSSMQSSSNASSSTKTSPTFGSASYLDDNNLQLAVIDYSDILKLIKLQTSIEYQEWIAFNSNFKLFCSFYSIDLQITPYNSFSMMQKRFLTLF